MDGGSVGIGHNSDIRSSLLEKHADKFKRKQDLLEAAARVPDIKDDEGAGKVGDFIKQVAHCRKSLEETRKVEKQPYDEMADQVHSLFKPAVDDLDKIKRQIENKLGAYLTAKEAKERAERERIANEKRAAEEAAAKAAAEAAASVETEEDLDAALDKEAEALRLHDDTAAALKYASAKPAELSRSRGEYGSVSSLRTTWDFRDLDPTVIDLEVLRPFLAVEALEKALRAFIKGGGRTIKGAVIFENKSAVVR